MLSTTLPGRAAASSAVPHYSLCKRRRVLSRACSIPFFLPKPRLCSQDSACWLIVTDTASPAIQILPAVFVLRSSAHRCHTALDCRAPPRLDSPRDGLPRLGLSHAREGLIHARLCFASLYYCCPRPSRQACSLIADTHLELRRGHAFSVNNIN